MSAKSTNAQYARIKLSDFSNSYVNGTAKNTSEMFEDIKRLADNNPNINFVYLFDEADGICSKLEHISSDHMHLKENRQSFLTGLEEIQRCKNVTTFAATNVEISELDGAVINRFGRTFKFNLPDKTQLYEGLKFHLNDCEQLKGEELELFMKNDSEVKKFVNEMYNRKTSFRDLAKIVQDAEARYCRAMAKAENDSLHFEVKYLKEALKDKGVNANELTSKAA
jgi:SpoVK/Ycf46/Vps4 family AAA+-type ATPase